MVSTSITNKVKFRIQVINLQIRGKVSLNATNHKHKHLMGMFWQHLEITDIKILLPKEIVEFK